MCHQVTDKHVATLTVLTRLTSLRLVRGREDLDRDYTIRMSTDCECSSAALCHLLGDLQDVINEPALLLCYCVADVLAGSVVVTIQQDSMPAHVSQQSRQCICSQIACCATCRPSAAADSCSSTFNKFPAVQA